MKKHLQLMALTLPLAWSTSTLGGWISFTADDIPKGTMCCVNQACLLAKTEADCHTAGGKVVKNCQACTGKAAPAKPEPKPPVPAGK